MNMGDKAPGYPADPAKKPLASFRILGKEAGIRVSPLQLGAMSIGEAWNGFMGSMDKQKSFELLDAYHELGGNFIDTANNYQNGESETWIGEWMKERGVRDQMVIATKFTTPWRTHYEFNANAGGNNRRSMYLSVNDSLKKLQTEWIDILYIHWLDWTTGIRELADALHILVQQGKVLYLGVSDTPAWFVSAFNEYAMATGKTPFCVYQGHWSVMLRDLEREVIPMAQHYGMAIAPWGALGSGKLQSKKEIEARKSRGETLRAMMGNGEQSELEAKYSEVLGKIGEKYGIHDSPATVALAYVLHKVPRVFPIVGGRKVEHLKANVEALYVNLTDDEIKEIEGVQEFDIGFPLNFIGTNPHTGGEGMTFLPPPGRTDWVREGKAITRPKPGQ